MSATTAVIAPARHAPDTGRRQERQHLTAVDPSVGQRRRPTLFYAAVAVAAVFAIVAVQLMMSIVVSQDAYRIEGLQTTKASLARDLQAVNERVDTLSSPQNLAAKAGALGMVEGNSPAYLKLSTGTVVGAPVPAAGAAAGTSVLVPNALLTPTSKPTAKKGTPQANEPAAQHGPVAWEGALPAPSTH